MISNLHNLNYFEKIIKNRGSYIVFGGPGTGKTLFLKELVVFLTENQNIDPKQILVLTFNRKSSKYLRDEIAIKAGRTVPEIEIKTFYSLCLDIFKDYISGIGLNRINGHENKSRNISFREKNLIEDIFTNNLNEIKILTAPEQWNLLTDIILEADEKKIPGIRKLFSNKNTIENILQEIFDYILRAQENLRNPAELFDKFNPYTNKILYEINTIYSDFNNILEEKKVFNYGKLMIDALAIIKSDNDLRQYYRKRYKFILVDELQELNFAQYSLLKELSDNNIIYFGDDDQSVYKFRGSNINIFFKVFDRIPPERKIFLNINYRNSFPILKIIENFISKNSLRINKNYSQNTQENIKSANRPYKNKGEIILKSFENRYGELNFIKNRIILLNKIIGVPLNKIAVIMKGTDFETTLIENYFYQNAIPFFRQSSKSVVNNRYSGYLLNICRLISLLDIKEKESSEDKSDIKKDELDKKINKVAVNIFLSDFLDIEPVLFKEIQFQYAKSASKNYKNIYSYLERNLKNIKVKDGESYLKISDFMKSVKKHKKNLKKDAFYFIHELISDKNIGLLEEIRNYCRLSQNDKNLFSVFTNFLSSIKNFCSERESEKDIGAYLDFIERFSNNQFIEETEEALDERSYRDSIRILSFYDCKNLEFDAVFIPFLNKGYFPSTISKPQIYEKDFLTYLVEGRFMDDEEIKHIHIENERKILFTGISRCRDFLYITCSSGQESSLFYEELQRIISEKNDIKKIIPKPLTNTIPKEQVLPATEKSLLRKKAIVSKYKINIGKNTGKTNYHYLLNYLKNHYSPAGWWDLISEKENNLNPFISDKNSGIFSYSAIDAYDDCPFKYKMRYFFRLRTEEENMSLIIGSLYHNIINRFFNECKKPDYDSLLFIMNEEIDAHENNFKYHFYLKEIRNEMNKNFNNFYNNFSYIIEDRDYSNIKDNVMTEKEFVFDINNKDKIKGKIDLINLRTAGILELIDFKSSKKKYSEKELEEELQLKIYHLAIKKSINIRQLIPDIDKRVIQARYYVIGNEDNNFFTVNISEETEEKTIAKILNIISNIKKEKFYINPRSYFSCKSCEYKIFCEKYYGEQL